MNYARSRYRTMTPSTTIGARYDAAVRIGQISLIEAAQRLRELRRVVFARDAIVRGDPRLDSPPKITLPTGSSAFVVRSPLVQFPNGWVAIEVTSPGSQGLGTVTTNGWVAIADLDPASPYLRANPPGPPVTSPAPGQGGPPIQTTPGGGVITPAPAEPSTLRSIGEFILLTSPAWGSYLYTRFVR